MSESPEFQSLPFEETLAKIRSSLPEKLQTPHVSIMCESGLHTLAAALREVVEIPYASLPGFGRSTVPEHKSSLAFGLVDPGAGVPVVVMLGRFHPYEGHKLAKVVYPIRVIDTLAVTNAAGALDGIIDCTHFNGAPYEIAQEIIPLLQHRPRDDETLVFRPILPYPPRCTFNEIIPLLRHRTTSKPEDETIAIAGLLGIDASELASLPTAESRMRTLLMRCGDLPRCIAVYGWDAYKLDVPGFTWAPVSVGGVFWSGDPLDPLWSTATAEGLRGLYTVVSFPPVDMERISGLVATVSRRDLNADRASENTNHLPAGIDHAYLGSVNSLAARTDPVTTGVRISLSHFSVNVRRRSGQSVVVNAVLITRPGLPPTEREEPVAAVFISSLATDTFQKLSSKAPLKCDFVAAGKIDIDPPGVKVTPSTLWPERNVQLHSLLPVLLS